MMLRKILKLRRLQSVLKKRQAELAHIQQKRLSALLKQAYRSVPYYTKLFDSVHLKPADIKGMDDLQALPITDKEDLRAKPLHEITSAEIDLKKCIPVTTSGSTGMPTQIYFTPEDLEMIDLIYLRSFLANGLMFRHKRAFVLDPHSLIEKRNWYQHLGLARSVNVSCFLPPEEQAEIIQKARPDFIHGYPSSLSEVAKVLLAANVTDLHPVLISTAAELMRNRDKKLIASAFGVTPYDRYAARECGSIAWECREHNGYHINMDSVIVEFIKDGRPAPPGSRADIVITNLNSYAMPFIRYRIGDVGVPSERECACGMALPLMEIVEGRDEDFILLANGRRIGPMVVTGTLDYVPGLKQFRVIQERADSVLVVLARGKDFGSETVAQVEKELRKIFDQEMAITCRVVDDIPRETSGKVRAVISKVA
jgi:phenylacetate-CoA ligase